jgi:N,N'-diacetylchitobiose non-reducing end deacetylase
MTDDILFSHPDLFTAKRVLVVQPHYDDNDIFAGGTLAKLAESGVELVYLTVTDDLVGVIDQSLSAEAMAAWLKDNQLKAGEIIGVKEQYWLGYPDAGQYDYFAVRHDIIQHIRLTRPDFVMTCDPWLPYEFHNDHIITGKAATEAAALYSLTRLATTAAVDEAFKQKPFDLKGIAFYCTAHPNTSVDISSVWEKKQRAVAEYTAQFSDEDMQVLQTRLEHGARHAASESGFTYGETVKVMYTWQLHGFADAWKV